MMPLEERCDGEDPRGSYRPLPSPAVEPYLNHFFFRTFLIEAKKKTAYTSENPYISHVKTSVNIFYTSLLPSSDLLIVLMSTYSMSPPAGIPWAMRVTVILNGLTTLAR